MRRSGTVFGLLGLHLGLVLAHGQEPVDSANSQSRVPIDHREELDDPPLSVERSEQTVSPALVWRRGPHESIQVNVGEFGNNIVGDAANEPSIAIDPTDPNTIVIGWRQFDSIASNFRTSGYAYSHDRGQTWTFPGVLEPGEFSSDPVLDFDLDGNIYYNALQPSRGPGTWACYIYKTSDGGVTWPQEVYVGGGDKQWMAIDRTSGIGSGNIYMAWSPWGSCCGADLFTRSTDGGLTYMNPIPLPGSPFFGTLTVDPDGTLYLVGASGYPDGLGDTLLVVRSTNAQDPLATPTFTLTAEVDLGGPLGLGGGPNPAGLLGQPWIATDHTDGPTRGNVYLLGSVDPPGGDPLDVMFSRSTDGGLEWSAPVRINDDPAGTDAWQWFGTMSVAPNGRIDVVFNDTRNSGVDNLSELHYSFSSDAGTTWSENKVISPMFDSHVGWPQQNKLGDYYDMISDNTGANLAWAATFNGEQDVYFLRISPFDCNANGVEDTQDITNLTSPDCNNNGVPDECEIDPSGAAPGGPFWCDPLSPPFGLSACDPDCNYTGVPDECELAGNDCNGNRVPDDCDPEVCACFPSSQSQVNPAMLDGGHGGAPRFISFMAGDSGHSQAIRVMFPTSMPAPYETWSLMQSWVALPQRYCENSGNTVAPNDTPPNFGCDPAPGRPQRWYMSATLECAPVYQEWHGVCVSGTCHGGMRAAMSCITNADCRGPVYIFHEGILPSQGAHNEPAINPTTYSVQVIDAFCDINDELTYSDPLELTTSKWGDIVINTASWPFGPPEGIVQITDVLAILAKFQNLATATVSARVDLLGATAPKYLPDHLIDIGDVLQALFAFQAVKYPSPAITGTPTARPCGD